MGTEKYLLNVNGKPQYQFIESLLSQLGIPTYLSCNKDQVSDLVNYSNLIVDNYDSIGPIGGILSAFEMDDQSPWLVIACDLTNLSQPAIQKLVESQDKNFDVITYQKKGSSYSETTLTIYNPSLKVYLEKAIDAQEYSLQKILNGCKVKAIYADIDDFLKNANSPEDIA